MHAQLWVFILSSCDRGVPYLHIPQVSFFDSYLLRVRFYFECVAGMVFVIVVLYHKTCTYFQIIINLNSANHNWGSFLFCSETVLVAALPRHVLLF